MDSVRENYFIWLFSLMNWLPLPSEWSDSVCVPSVCVPCKRNTWAVVRSAWPYSTAQLGLRIRITYQNHLVMQCKLHSATKENSENNRKTQPTSHAAFTRDYMIRLRSICGSLCMLFISGEEPTQFITRDVTFVNRKVEEILHVNSK